MKFNEDSRVKIPAILHLTRLGFQYLSLKGLIWDASNNIFTNIFNPNIKRLNPNCSESDVKRLYHDISVALENDDLGRAFYQKLMAKSGMRLLDFDNFEQNAFHVVTELPCKKDEDEFRPDITLLINGMPLVFIEVKKPNNQSGILAEHKRMEARFKNKKFKKFINITQLMVFSNNMEYDPNALQPVQGAFYATTAYEKPIFNYFREEDTFDLDSLLKTVSDADENAILKDNNLVSIKHSADFIVNKNPLSPTNRICTSLFQPKRLAFLLQYGLAYVENKGVLQKHIMRYPQLFATKAIESKLEKGVKAGIVWHTQGSGKTALAYYNVNYLTDYFHKKGIIAKFYFIVDRLSLLEQADREFNNRNLIVHKIESRKTFASDIKSPIAIHNHSGKPEITVVNIQKFEDDPCILRKKDYNIHIQRIYFLDEVHRSYNPKGSFLSNLEESDVHAIKIGLTGTPLLGDDASKRLFGDYFHKYYYNASIADGYTLRLIREEIETQYRLSLVRTLEEIQLLKGAADKEFTFAHPKFVEPMLDYIVRDLETARIALNDDSMGGMIVCHSSKQAKQLYEIFQAKYAAVEPKSHAFAEERAVNYNAAQKQARKVTSAALILHDAGTKHERTLLTENFKAGHIDFIIVFNMLLTGFDAPRLKKLYMGRVVKAHNLLQALTRVNRTYRDFKYGYVVDFEDIQTEFDKTNQKYFEELQAELGDNEMAHYSNIFKSDAEIDAEIQEIQDFLFMFDTETKENFVQQIEQIEDRKQMLEIVKVLDNARTLRNHIRLAGKQELLERLDFQKLAQLAREANARLTLINYKEDLNNDSNTHNLLNIALEEVYFAFVKVSESEMVLADQLKDILQKARESLLANFDPKDPEFVSLKQELERLFKSKNLKEVYKTEMEANINDLQIIYNASKELERKNQLLKAQYDHDEKYARLHKRLMEQNQLTVRPSKLFEALQCLKREVDHEILNNTHIIENEGFIEAMILRLVVQQLHLKHQLPLRADQAKGIRNFMVKEYLNEFRGNAA